MSQMPMYYIGRLLVLHPQRMPPSEYRSQYSICLLGACLILIPPMDDLDRQSCRLGPRWPPCQGTQSIGLGKPSLSYSLRAIPSTTTNTFDVVAWSAVFKLNICIRWYYLLLCNSHCLSKLAWGTPCIDQSSCSLKPYDLCPMNFYTTNGPQNRLSDFCRNTPRSRIWYRQEHSFPDCEFSCSTFSSI